MISFEAVSKVYTLGGTTVKALDDVGFQIPFGEFVAVVGRSGSGKSTLLHVLAAMEPPTSGTIQVGDWHLGQLDKRAQARYRREMVGMVFQKFNLIPSMTAWQNVAMPLMLAGVAPARREKQVASCLEQVGLSHRTQHRPAELSGGEQQRVAIARALVHDPPILLADEPTGNLDSTTGRHILDLLVHLHATQNKTIVVVTHHPQDVSDVADRVITLQDGSLAIAPGHPLNPQLITFDVDSPMMRLVTPEEAVAVIASGDRVFVHTAVAAPQGLVQAMTARAPELRDVEVIHLHTEGPAPYADPSLSESFRTNCLFVGGNVRRAVASGEADYIPVFLSEVPGLFRKGILPLDVAMVQVSQPDKHGFCTLGVSVDVSLAAVQCARVVLAQINPRMPRAHGDGMIHISQIDYAFIDDRPIPEIPRPVLTEVEEAIGRHVASLIDDRATLQMGIGAIPDAVLAALDTHKDLGIHTEMFSDGVIELVRKGVVTGKYKRKHPGKIVSSFLMGSRALYDFVDDNPHVAMLDVEYVNDTAVIRKNPKVTAINSAIEVSLTGQVCADSIGTRQYSGVGGQMDFIRGAALSEGGKPIIALPSATRRGESRIVNYLKEGAGVVTTRAHMHYVVTEYGIANLYGKNLRQRARALIGIAHPDHREELERQAYERFKRL